MNINPTIKYVLTFLAGLGVGGFAVHSVYMKKIEELNMSLANAYETLEDVWEGKAVEDLGRMYEDHVAPYTGESDPDFDAHFAERESPEEDEDEEIDEYVEDPHTGERRDRPYFISGGEFQHSKYDTECLYYYISNKILTFEKDNGIDERAISDPENFLGVSVWTELSRLTAAEDNPILFVRNDNLETDYEIYILNHAYEYEEDDEAPMSLDEAMLYYNGEEEVDE